MERKITRKQLREQFMQAKDHTEELLAQRNVQVSDLVSALERQLDIYIKFREEVTKLIEKHSVWKDVEKIARYKAEVKVMEALYKESEAAVKVWIARQKRKTYSKPKLEPIVEDLGSSIESSESDSKKGAVGGVGVDYGGARPRTRSETKRNPNPTVPSFNREFAEEVARSIIKMCGWNPLEDKGSVKEEIKSEEREDMPREMSFKPTATSTPADRRERSGKGKYFYFEKNRSLELSDSSDKDSSENSVEESSDSGDECVRGPLLSVSDLMHGLGGIPGAQYVGLESKKDRRKRMLREKKLVRKKKDEKQSYERFMNKIELPIFDGSGDFDSWWSIFQSLVDESDEPVAVKFLRMRNSLAGEPLSLIKYLPHDADSYMTAKRRIYDMFGGMQRGINRMYAEVHSFPAIENTNDFDNLKRLLAKLDHLIQQLKAANRISELGHGSLVTLMVGKMPFPVIEKYHEWRFTNDFPDSLTSLSMFLEQYISRGVISLETLMGVRGTLNVSGTGKSKRGRSTLLNNEKKKDVAKSNAHSTIQSNIKKQEVDSGMKQVENQADKRKCRVCKGPHPLWYCNQFKDKDLDGRWEIIKGLHVCFRCFSAKHRADECPANKLCGVQGCPGKHHRLLHRDKKPEQAPTATANVNVNSKDNETSVKTTEDDNSNEKHTHVAISKAQYLSRKMSLRTVPVRLHGPERNMEVLALLDDASTTTYLNEDVARELGLRGVDCNSCINVLDGHQVELSTELVSICVESLDGAYRFTEIAELSNNVIQRLEIVDWAMYKHNWPHLNDIDFPSLHNHTRVDMLIGSNFLPLLEAKEEICGPVGSPMARRTPLGWSCIGSPGVCYGADTISAKHSFYGSRDKDMNIMLEKFWHYDAIPSCEERTLSPEERKATEIVDNSIKKEGGNYKVDIPWIYGYPEVPNNLEQAIQRLISTEKRLLKYPEIAVAYNEVFLYYLKKGYIIEVPEEEWDKIGRVWYLSHFFIHRPDRPTSKVRPVFNTAAKYRNICISDFEYAGPKELQDLLAILLRFRRFPYALSCDIKEMFLQILLGVEDQDYQRFVWRFLDTKAKPRIFRGTRVMFGKRSSPFLALKVTQHNARLHQDDFPLAAMAILLGTYMDDTLDSQLNENLLIKLYEELQYVWSQAGMSAHKWATNSLTLLDMIPKDQRAPKVDLLSESPGQTKMLGSSWYPEYDTFSFVKDSLPQISEITKRSVLRVTASLFDPMGLISPFIIRAKVLMQVMWIQGVDWDDVLVDWIQEKVKKWMCEFDELEQFNIDRAFIKHEDFEHITLHVFGDASELAYGAIAFLVVKYKEHATSSTLIMSKAKVAPIRSLPMPRMELEAAVVAANIASYIQYNLVDVPIDETVLWSDSHDVLFWICSFSRSYKPYVANRIGKIQEKSRPVQWKYVPSMLNPADILSRGATLDDIASSSLWLHGPEYIRQDMKLWPVQPAGIQLSALAAEEAKNDRFTLFSSKEYRVLESSMEIGKYSSLGRLVRIFAWVLRFIESCRMNAHKGETLSKTEIENARLLLIRQEQGKEWLSEIERIERGDQVSMQSPIRSLAPWLDDDLILRAKMRTGNANFLPWETSNPIILPRYSSLTKLIAKDIHDTNHHVGIEHSVALFRKEYYVPAVREIMREINKNCAYCKIYYATPAKQQMGVLPADRLNAQRVFQKSAIDFAGPFYVKLGRGRTQQKRWLFVATCLAVRAVHLDIVWSMDTDAFINALTRFTNKRGPIEDIYCDNGSNIVGGVNELRDVLSSLDQNRIVDMTTTKGIEWHFQPPSAPHFGGSHESMVKSAKRALWKIAGQASLNDDELLTVTSQAEALLNSRPLTYGNTGLNEPPVLTPAHFIHGSVSANVLPGEIGKVPESARHRWRYVQNVVSHFWNRWRIEYVPTLGPRRKWFKIFGNIKVGDVVLVSDMETVRGRWPLGRVTAVFPGDDGLVRAVNVRIGKKEFKRPIVKLCPIGC